jgi:hypothetical protein
MEQAVQGDQAQDFVMLSRAAEEFGLAKWVMAVKRTYNKGYCAQIFDFRKLKRGAGKIIALEYSLVRLYDDAPIDHKAKLAFRGGAGRPAVYTNCNDRAWAEVEEDKLASAALLAGQGFAMPETFALLHPDRSVEGLRSRASPQDRVAYPRNGAAYRFFGQPLDATESVGVIAVDAHEAASDSLVLTDGRRVPVADCLDKIGHFHQRGDIFQEQLKPSAPMQELVGDRLSTVRIMVRLKASGPEVFRPVWKIPVGDNMADNVWRDGNLLAAIARASATATRVIIGFGPEEVEVESHPNTGAKLQGVLVRTGARCPSSASRRPGIFRVCACRPGMSRRRRKVR